MPSSLVHMLWLHPIIIIVGGYDKNNTGMKKDSKSVLGGVFVRQKASSV